MHKIVHTIRNQNAMKQQSQKISVHLRTRVGSGRCSSSSSPEQQDILYKFCYCQNKALKTTESTSI